VCGQRDLRYVCTFWVLKQLAADAHADTTSNHCTTWSKADALSVGPPARPPHATRFHGQLSGKSWPAVLHTRQWRCCSLLFTEECCGCRSVRCPMVTTTSYCLRQTSAQTLLLHARACALARVQDGQWSRVETPSRRRSHTRTSTLRGVSCPALHSRSVRATPSSAPSPLPRVPHWIGSLIALPHQC
jgi:hypothetical protein